MAKIINISNDGGSSYKNFPGSEGSYNADAEAASDTILVETYDSSEVGLISWTIGTNGIFKGFAGYLAEIKKIGAAVVADGEAMTLESGKTFGITDATKEVWDRSDTVVVYDNAVDKTADVLSIDYLFGRITFKDAYSVTTPITVDVSYFPVTQIGGGNSYTLGMTAATKDTSDYVATQANGGFRTFEAGLRSVTLEVGGIFNASEAAMADLAARTELIIEIDAAGDGSSIARGFFKLMNTGQSGSVGAVEDETTQFVLTVPQEDLMEFPFNWRHTATTLHLSIQYAITSWLTELNTYDMQYLPTGAIGASPNDGKSGDVVITDISLSGGLSDMNVFSITAQGTGAVTTV